MNLLFAGLSKSNLFVTIAVGRGCVNSLISSITIILYFIYQLSYFSFLNRWFIVHVPFVRFMRQILFVSNDGPSPPPILRLSDGGHIENLAILPLLKKRLSKIVVVDGGHKNEDSEWGYDLVKALSLAREKLHCSFTALDGRDVLEDVKEKFINTPPGHQTRSYRSADLQFIAFFKITLL